MFGIFRYTLSLMVVYTHLWNYGVFWMGNYAVFGFYMLSGYLMPLTLLENYGTTLRGRAKFLANRALRIYPSYFVILIFAIFVVSLAPGIARKHNHYLIIPTSMHQWVENITVILLSHNSPSRLLPPAWSLSVELFFYLGIGLFLSRNKRLTILWFSASVLYTIYMITHAYSFNTRYFPVFAASLPFSTGAMLYYFRGKLHMRSPKLGLLILSLYGINALFSKQIWNNVYLQGFYASYLMTAFVLVFLMKIKVKQLPLLIQKIDKYAGNMAYPIFLLHYPMSVFVSYLFHNNSTFKKGILFTCSLILVNVAAFIVYWFVDRKINLIRDILRKKKPAFISDAQPADIKVITRESALALEKLPSEERS